MGTDNQKVTSTEVVLKIEIIFVLINKQSQYVHSVITVSCFLTRKDITPENQCFYQLIGILDDFLEFFILTQ